MKQSISEWFSQFPDLHFTIHDMVVEGDKIAIRYTWTGTNKGEVMGMPPINKKVTTWMIEIDHFAGGKQVECWARMDTVSLMQQLSVAPTPKKEK